MRNMRDTWDGCGRSLEEQLRKATGHLTKLKIKYRELRRFLEDKGVPAAYFEEWNARFNEGYRPDRGFITSTGPRWRDARTDPPTTDMPVRVVDVWRRKHLLAYRNGKWDTSPALAEKLTHWLDCPPLPEPPL